VRLAQSQHSQALVERCLADLAARTERPQAGVPLPS
jgi:hypothetical protein